MPATISPLRCRWVTLRRRFRQLSAFATRPAAAIARWLDLYAHGRRWCHDDIAAAAAIACRWLRWLACRLMKPLTPPFYCQLMPLRRYFRHWCWWVTPPDAIISMLLSRWLFQALMFSPLIAAAFLSWHYYAPFHFRCWFLRHALFSSFRHYIYFVISDMAVYDTPLPPAIFIAIAADAAALMLSFAADASLLRLFSAYYAMPDAITLPLRWYCFTPLIELMPLFRRFLAAIIVFTAPPDVYAPPIRWCWWYADMMPDGCWLPLSLSSPLLSFISDAAITLSPPAFSLPRAVLPAMPHTLLFTPCTCFRCRYYLLLLFAIFIDYCHALMMRLRHYAFAGHYLLISWCRHWLTLLLMLTPFTLIDALPPILRHADAIIYDAYDAIIDYIYFYAFIYADAYADERDATPLLFSAAPLLFIDYFITPLLMLIAIVIIITLCQLMMPLYAWCFRHYAAAIVFRRWYCRRCCCYADSRWSADFHAIDYFADVSPMMLPRIISCRRASLRFHDYLLLSARLPLPLWRWDCAADADGAGVTTTNPASTPYAAIERWYAAAALPLTLMLPCFAADAADIDTFRWCHFDAADAFTLLCHFLLSPRFSSPLSSPMLMPCCHAFRFIDCFRF